MKRQYFYLVLWILLGSGLFAWQQWSQQLLSGSFQQRKEALQKIVRTKQPRAFEFVYQKVLKATDPALVTLKPVAVEELARTKTPQGLYYAFRAFTMANLVYASRFREAIYPHCSKKLTLRLAPTVLSDPASDWASGQAFFVDIVARRKLKKLAKRLYALYLRTPHEEVKKSVLFALLDLSPKKVPKLCAQALRDKSVAVRKTALRVLSTLGTSKALRLIGAALKDSDVEVQKLAVQLLSDAKAKSQVRPLMRLLRSSNSALRQEVLRALRHILGDRAKPYFLKAAKDADWQIRHVAIFHLKDFGKDPKFLSVYKKALREEYPQIQSAAVWGLYSLASKEATKVLIDALSYLQGTAKQDAVRALQLLSGEKFSTPEDWRQWWEREQDSYRPREHVDMPYTPPKGALEGDSESSSASGRRTVLRRRRPKFFGTVVESYHVGFVIDCSTSMNAPMEVTLHEGPARRTRLKGRGKRVKKPRLEVAKRELILAIAALDSRAKFNIFFFGDNFTRWREKAVVANSKNKDSAIHFVRSRTYMGATNLYDPLEKMLLDPDIDTIYVLSDGAPNRGKYSNPADILKAVREINQKRKVRIFTIGIGVFGATEDFLRDLAEQNGGKFIKVE